MGLGDGPQDVAPPRVEVASNSDRSISNKVVDTKTDIPLRRVVQVFGTGKAPGGPGWYPAHPPQSLEGLR